MASKKLSMAGKAMLQSLKSLYDENTLLKVANEVLKLTGQMKGSGRSTKSIKDIASYIIKGIGASMAILLALFIIKEGGTSSYHKTAGYDQSNYPSFEFDHPPEKTKSTPPSSKKKYDYYKPEMPPMSEPKKEQSSKLTKDEELLGIDKNSSLEDVRKAYRKKSLIYHPDKPGGSEEMFKELANARDRQIAMRGGRIRKRKTDNIKGGVINFGRPLINRITDMMNQYPHRWGLVREAYPDGVTLDLVRAVDRFAGFITTDEGVREGLSKLNMVLSFTRGSRPYTNDRYAFETDANLVSPEVQPQITGRRTRFHRSDSVVPDPVAQPVNRGVRDNRLDRVVPYPVARPINRGGKRKSERLIGGVTTDELQELRHLVAYFVGYFTAFQPQPDGNITLQEAENWVWIYRRIENEQGGTSWDNLIDETVDYLDTQIERHRMMMPPHEEQIEKAILITAGRIMARLLVEDMRPEPKT